MARRSLRLSSDGKSKTSNHKRVASNSEVPRDLVKRPKKQVTTPVKSQYFAEHEDGKDEDGSEIAPTDESSSPDESASDFEDGESDEKVTPSESDGGESEEVDSADDAKPRRKAKPSRATNSSADVSVKSDLWKPGVKTGLGPGKQVIIKKPKARAAGKTPYRDETIHPNTFLFLADLKANNKREWLKMNDADFRASEKDFYSFVDKMSEKLTEIDDTIPELPVKDIIFRIYRDVRFSKDPTPYKLLGGGIWMPEAAPLDALRRDVDRNPQRIKEVVSDERLCSAFFRLPKTNSKQAVKAFLKQNAESALKTRPKGYAADHPDIELMRLKNYTIGRKLADEEVLGEAGVARIAELLACLKPWITYLNSVVMPDDPESEEDGEADSDEDEENEGEEEGSEDDAGDE